MEKSKMLCLNWNDFSSSLSDSAKELKDDQDFLDVTLAFDDDEQIKANKFMLSICSPFFRRILKRNIHSHPLLYLRGIKSANMRKMLDFIYHGEVHISESELSCFLTNAKELELKGLTEKLPIEESTQTSHNKPFRFSDNSMKVADAQNKLRTNYILKPKNEPQINFSNTDVEHFANDEQSACVTIMDDVDEILSYDNPEISYDATSYAEEDESFTKSYIDNNMLVDHGMFVCKECGKAFSRKQVLENHIEIHMDNSYQCSICQKPFKTRNSLKSHLSQRHRNK